MAAHGISSRNDPLARWPAVPTLYAAHADRALPLGWCRLLAVLAVWRVLETMKKER
jgi:hypothetical protein